MALGVALSIAAAGQLRAQDAAALALDRGDSAWAAGDRALARDSYQRVVDADSASSPRAVFRLATLLAWANEFPRSLALYRFYNRLESRDHGGRVALARTLAWAGRYDESVALYDSVVAGDSSARDAVLGGAQALAWESKYAESMRRLGRWMASHPDDIEARLAFAQTLAWDGRLREAEAMYVRLAGEGAGIGAEKGLARVVAWDGDLERSESLWRGLAARVPSDPEVWTGLAQVLRWRGHLRAARIALGSALAADPQDRDARAQLRSVDAELASAIEPSVVSSFDRDENYSTLLTVGATIAPLLDGRLMLTASRRDASLGDSHGGATLARGSATGLRVTASQPFGDRLTVRAEAGATRLAEQSPGAGAPAGARRAVTIGSWSARATGRPWRALALGVAASRTALDETASLIARGMAIQSVDGDADVALPLRLSVSASVSHASVQGGSVANDRDAFTGAVRWQARRQLFVGAGARTMGYRADGRPDAYFSPARFALIELTTGWTLGRELGWWGTLDGGVGPQAIRFHSAAAGEPGVVSRKLAERVSLGAGYRFAPGLEIGISAGAANVASSTAVGVADYRAYVLGVRGRVTL
jgi:tetratricopeptide (TPR) repeat protein